MTAGGTLDVDLLSPQVLVDPYPTYAALREHDPVHWDDTLQGWVVTRNADVYAALRDPARFSSDRIERLVTSRVPAAAADLVAPFIRLTAQWLWMQDPPSHTRLRRLVNKGFTPRAVAGLRAFVEQTVDALLDKVADGDRFDLVAEFAYPLPALVLAHVYGLPAADADLLKRWSDSMKVFIGGSPSLGGTAAEAVGSLDEMMRYFTEAVRERQRHRRDDLVSRLVDAKEGADFLNEEELCANLVLVLAASYVTTMDMIGNGMLALLRQREQWQRLLDDPGLVPTAIDELLRYDGPVQLTHRLATEDISLRGRTIPRGDLVYLIRGAANRDPERYADPDRVDVGRADTGHVAFGAGPHYCIGAALARLEGDVAFTALLRRFPGIDLDPDDALQWRADTLQFRGLRRLPVVTSAS